MNIFLKKMLKDAEKRKANNSAPPLKGLIRGEKQDRPLPDDLLEKTDLPYAERKGTALRADVVYPRTRKTETLPVAVFVHGGALVLGDRKSDRVFCQELARQGFVVYSLEYRLIDQTDACGMAADITEGLRLVQNTLGSFGGDPRRVSLCGESAGAFLCLYAAAAGSSAKYRQLFSCRGYDLKLSGLVLIGGMLYTANNDPIGLVYRHALYQEKTRDRRFMQIISPEYPRLISLLPPVLMISSGADFLHRQSFKYAGALKQNGHSCRLMYFPEGKELTHAFPALLPSLPESGTAIRAMGRWMKSLQAQSVHQSLSDLMPAPAADQRTP